MAGKKWYSGKVPRHKPNSDVLKYFNTTIHRIMDQKYCFCDACKIRNETYLREYNVENSKITTYDYGLNIPTQITFSANKILENKKSYHMLNEVDLSCTFQTTFYLLLRSDQKDYAPVVQLFRGGD